jgi:hypothetical protein
MKQYVETVDSIDRDRHAHFERAGARPTSRIAATPAPPTKEIIKARGRRRTAAWRCGLDRRRAPESTVVGLALLTAVVSLRKHELDPGVAKIVNIAFADLIGRGYERAEVEQVFYRFKSKVVDKARS